MYTCAAAPVSVLLCACVCTRLRVPYRFVESCEVRQKQPKSGFLYGVLEAFGNGTGEGDDVGRLESGPKGTV
jgi:hypothetical protein